MYSKGSNLVSVTVAFISLGLIVLAVFLLNQTFSNKPGVASSSGASSSFNTVSGRASLATFSNTSSNKTSSSESNNISASSSSLSSSVASSSSNSGNSSSKSSNSNNSSSQSAGSSASNQLTAKFIGDQSGVNYEIANCQINNPKRCKPGFKFLYSDTKEKTIGETYKFDGCEINDKDDSFELSNCKISK